MSACRAFPVRLLAPVVLLFPGWAATPPLTTIQDTLFKADGSRFNGVAFVDWKGFSASDSSVIAPQSLTVKIVNGVLRVQLVPTTNATPGASYRVRYSSDGKIQFEETWAVPPSSTALRLRDIRVTSGPVAPAQGTQILESDVVGLPADLSVRPVKGTGYYPSRVAFVSSTGAMESVTGNLSDCVRVDGTSGPCGTGAAGFDFIDNEAPSGAIDGTNASFALTGTPEPAGSLLLHRNGILLRQGADYSLTGNAITFATGGIPLAGDSMLASYRVAGTGTDFDFVDNEVPAGVVDGVNAAFSLTGTPQPVASISIHRNGILQQRGADFSISGRTILFLPGAVPQAGDAVLASYRRAKQ